MSAGSVEALRPSLRGVGGPQDDQAGRPVAPDQLRVGVRNVVGEQPRSSRLWQPRHLSAQVLHHEGHPGEWRLAVDRRRLRCRPVEARGDERAQRRVALLGPGDRGRHHVAGVDLPGTNRCGDRRGVVIVEQPFDVRSHVSPLDPPAMIPADPRTAIGCVRRGLTNRAHETSHRGIVTVARRIEGEPWTLG